MRRGQVQGYLEERLSKRNAGEAEQAPASSKVLPKVGLILCLPCSMHCPASALFVRTQMRAGFPTSPCNDSGHRLKLQGGSATPNDPHAAPKLINIHFVGPANIDTHAAAACAMRSKLAGILGAEAVASAVRGRSIAAVRRAAACIRSKGPDAGVAAATTCRTGITERG